MSEGISYRQYSGELSAHSADPPSGTWWVNELPIEVTNSVVCQVAFNPFIFNAAGSEQAIDYMKQGTTLSQGERRFSYVANWFHVISQTVSGASGLGEESLITPGTYITSQSVSNFTYTPQKENVGFSPESITYEHIPGRWGALLVFSPGPVVLQKAKNPTPDDNDENINRAINLSWSPGNYLTDNYDVYFGTVGNLVLVATEITNEFFDIHDYSGGLNLNTEYEWRIDSFTSEGTERTGDVWSYTTRAQRTVILSAPTDGVTGKLLPPFLLDWTIDGIGAQYGSYEDQDFLFIYLRANNANFTEDDLISNYLQAYYNSDLQIVGGLQYGTTYYWQVQAGNTATDLADSGVWSFTMLDFLPPLYSTKYKLTYGEPGGPGDPEGDPGPQGGGSQPGTGNVGEIPSGGSHPGGEGEGDSPDIRNYEVIPSGKNSQLTTQRLIAAAKNKIFYEDV